MGIDGTLLGMMRDVFGRHEGVRRALLFGSRAKGTQKENSDIDIAISGCDGNLFCEKIAYELEFLPTLLKFDVIDYEKIKNHELKEHIDRVGKVLFERKV